MVIVEAEVLNQLSRRGSSLDVTLVIGNRDFVLPKALSFCFSEASCHKQGVAASTIPSRSLLSTKRSLLSSPVVTRINPVKSSPAGGSAMFIYGSNLDTPTVAIIGSTTCTSHEYIAASVFSCNEVPKGVGASIAVAASNSNGQSSVSNFFSYLPPTILAAVPTAVAQVSPTLTVRGSNFGTYDSTMSASVIRNSVALDAPGIKYVSDTQVELLLKPNSGDALTVTVTIGNQIATMDNAFSYRAPSVSSLLPGSLGTSGGSILTVFGANFGIQDLSCQVKVGDTSAPHNVAVSDSSLLVTVPAGRGLGKTVSVTTASLVGSSVATFSYFAPSISNLSPSNTPTSGLLTMSIFGSNFAGFSETPTITLGSTRCASEWVSSTSILCRVPRGVGAGLQVLVNVEGQTVSVTRAWSYNAPAVSSISPVAGSTTGAVSVTLSGAEFGFAGNSYNPSSSIGPTSCTTVLHVSDTSVLCRIAPGISDELASSVSVSEQSGVLTKSFSYSAPDISSVTRVNVGTIPVAFVWGKNFGINGYCVSMYIGSTTCNRITWTSDSSVKCEAVSGYLKGLDIVVEAGNQKRTSTAAFSYSSPDLLSVNPNFALSYQSSSTVISILGSYMGDNTANVTARVGNTACSSVSYINSDTVIKCILSSGAGQGLNITINVSGTLGVLNAAFSYVPPSLISVYGGSNSPLTGSSVVTVLGSNFGPCKIRRYFLWAHQERKLQIGKITLRLTSDQKKDAGEI